MGGGRVVSIMRDPRVENPHNVHLSCSPVSMELFPGGPGSCLVGLGPWRVPRNPGEPLGRGATSFGSCLPQCLGPCGLRVIRWLLREFSLNVPLTRCSNCWLPCSYGTHCVDNGAGSGWTACYRPCRRRPAISPCHRIDESRHILGLLVLLFYVGHVCVVALAVLISCFITC
jgi:hypothetical protein